MLVRGGAAYCNSVLVALLALLQSEKGRRKSKLGMNTNGKSPEATQKQCKKGSGLFFYIFFCGRWKACKAGEPEPMEDRVEATARGIAGKQQRTNKLRGEKKERANQYTAS